MLLMEASHSTLTSLTKILSREWQTTFLAWFMTLLCLCKNQFLHCMWFHLKKSNFNMNGIKLKTYPLILPLQLWITLLLWHNISNNIAVLAQEDSITYQQLDTFSTQLAHELVSLGVKPESLVGICVDQSSWRFIVTILGIWKAGGAYIPLYLKLPQDRLEHMMNLAKASCVVFESKFIHSLPSQVLDDNRVSKVVLDESWTSIMNKQYTSTIKAPSPHNLAYILFTSGSTGTTKFLVSLLTKI